MASLVGTDAYWVAVTLPMGDLKWLRLPAETNEGGALATIRDEAEAFLERLQSPEAAEAFTAFFEKRSPDFSSFS